MSFYCILDSHNDVFCAAGFLLHIGNCLGQIVLSNVDYLYVIDYVNLFL